MDVFWLVFRFLTCSGNFLKCNFKLALAMSLNALKKLTKKELPNMVNEYQNQFHNVLSNKNTELNSLRGRVTIMGSQLLVTRRVKDNLVKQNHILERKCAANEQYSRQECLEILGFPGLKNFNEPGVTGNLRC